MKRCSKCGEVRERSEFSPCKKARSGLKSWCKPCAAADRRARYPSEYLSTKAAPAKYERMMKRIAVWKERRRQDTDYRRTENTRDRAKMMSDPVRHQRYLDQRKRRRSDRAESDPDFQRNISRKRAGSQKRWALANKGKCRDSAARYYSDPIKAARMRAKSTLRQSMNVPISLLPKDLIEAKAAQLLVHRFIKKGK